ncbi:MAG: vWA domain-containing protein [Micromonosporaceae bacterium]
MPDSGAADLARVAAGFGAALRAEGLPAGTDRCERFARAVTVTRPATIRELYWCGLATLVSDPDQIEAFARVFAAVFGGMVDPADSRGQQGDQGEEPLPTARTTTGRSASAGQADASPDRRGNTQEPEAQGALRAISSADERLASRDFAELSPDELAMLAQLMSELAVATPPRRTRRYRRTPAGRKTDLRTTLRRARRTGGEPFRLARGAPRTRPRRRVVLCDISGSMEPYARAMLQLLYCATGATRAEVFTFATRLTRLTPALAATRPAVALARAGLAAPDWSGGTRIGEALKEFNDLYGCRGMARGAVILVISDGWETGDPAQLGTEMARLSRVAHRIVWANPRTQSPRYRAEVGGMAAAWPYCDAVVSAHSLTALADLISALADPSRPRRSFRSPAA